jgi:hypothetical protein
MSIPCSNLYGSCVHVLSMKLFAVRHVVEVLIAYLGQSCHLKPVVAHDSPSSRFFIRLGNFSRRHRPCNLRKTDTRPHFCIEAHAEVQIAAASLRNCGSHPDVRPPFNEHRNAVDVCHGHAQVPCLVVFTAPSL